MRIKLLTLALAAITATAQLPDDLKSQATDTDAAAFFLAMDRVEKEFPDATSQATYDAYPDGVKIITRRIDITVDNAKLTDYICHVFDSITALPNADRIVAKNSIGNKMSRVYKIKTDPYDNTVDLSDLTAINSSSAAAVVKQGNNITIVQSWTINSNRRLGAPDLKALNNRIAKLQEQNNTTVFTTKQDYTESKSNGVRVRKSHDQKTDYVDIKHITFYNTNVSNWINLHHQFMAYLGANANISLTYMRNERYVTITDYANKTIYAAKYSQSAIAGNGSLYVALAKYSGQQPYIPSNWWSESPINK